MVMIYLFMGAAGVIT